MDVTQVALKQLARLRLSVELAKRVQVAQYLAAGACPLELYVPLCDHCGTALSGAGLTDLYHVIGYIGLVWQCRCGEFVYREYRNTPLARIEVLLPPGTPVFTLGKAASSLP